MEEELPELDAGLLTLRLFDPEGRLVTAERLEELPEPDAGLLTLRLFDPEGRLVTAGRLEELPEPDAGLLTLLLPDPEGRLLTAGRLEEPDEPEVLDWTRDEPELLLVWFLVLFAVTFRRVSVEDGLVTVVFVLGLLVGRRFTVRWVSSVFFRRSTVPERRV